MKKNLSHSQEQNRKRMVKKDGHEGARFQEVPCCKVGVYMHTKVILIINSPWETMNTITPPCLMMDEADAPMSAHAVTVASIRKLTQLMESSIAGVPNPRAMERS